MLPDFPIDDSSYIDIGNGVHIGKLIRVVFARSIKASNFLHLFFCELGAWMVFAYLLFEHAPFMEFVAGGGYVFQIMQSVVGLVTVLVVYLFVLGAWPYKDEQYKAVNGEVRSGSIFKKGDAKVSGWCGRQAAHTFRKRSRSFCSPLGVHWHGGLEALDAPEVTNLIKPLISGDVAPLFTFKLFWGKILLSHVTAPFSYVVRGTFGVHSTLRPLYFTTPAGGMH